MFASMLDIPCVVNATGAAANGETLSVRQLLENGSRDWTVPLPALITLCEWSHRLRLPTISGLRRSAKADITVVQAGTLGLKPEECGLRASPTRVIHVSARPVGVRPCQKMTEAEALPLLAEGQVIPL